MSSDSISDKSVSPEKIYKYIKEKNFIEFEPKFCDADTAFERMLFSGVGLYFELIRKLNKTASFENDTEKTLCIFGYNNDKSDDIKLLLTAKISDKENLIIGIFDMLYNFYSDINDNFDKDHDEIVIGFLEGDSSILFKIKHREPCKDVYREKDKMISPTILKKFEVDNINDCDSFDMWFNLYSDLINTCYIKNEVKEELEQVFKELSDKCYDVLWEMANKYSAKGKYGLPSVKTITEYLEAYYNTAKLCIREYDIFSQSKEAQEKANRILNFGIINTEKKISGTKADDEYELNRFWIISPFAINSLRNVYERAIVFADEANSLYEDCSEALRAVLVNNFVSSAIEDFKRWVYIKGENTLITFEGQSNILHNYKCSKLSSISLVRAIRFYEKIKTFINELPSAFYNKFIRDEVKKNIKKLNICFVGYTRIIKDKDNRKRAIEIEEVRDLVKRSFNDISINYTVILNSINKNKQNFKYEKDEDIINVNYIDYSEQFARSNMQKLLGKNHLVFFIDCPNLYYDEFYPSYDVRGTNIYNILNNTSYSENYNNAELGKNIGAKGILSEIDSQLEALSNRYLSGYGGFQPMVREYILDFIEQTVKESKEPKAAYCYLSGMEFLEPSRYEYDNVMHIEKYNSKCFYILKFGNAAGNKMELPEIPDESLRRFDNSVTEPVCFSLWNIIKNVSIGLKETLFKPSVDMGEFYTPYLLDNIGIELSWDKTMENYKIMWGISPKIREAINNNKIFYEIDEDEITGLLGELFEIVLGCKKGMLYEPVMDAVSNVLLGRAKNPIHILQYYRTVTGILDVNSIVCQKIVDDDQINSILDRNKISSVADKKLYIDFMKLYGIFSVDSIQKSAIKLRICKNNSDPNEIFKNIYEALIMCEYTESNLYYNMGA